MKDSAYAHDDWAKFDNEEMRRLLEIKQGFYLRVWSWLRMNAGGVPNTCKSSEKIMIEPSGDWLIGKRRTGE